ncbi:PQQ-dependent sugar dehydrogenase [Emticicia sp. SJ17W-69]|uniref:PQQ-dependent sugar dehydrogenase n=1 Tax=Emticicia sp. SJ17W-69 TaxID=3421657 RepID=UPI003EC0816D
MKNMTTLWLKLTILLIFFGLISQAQPSGFIDEVISNEWNSPTGLTFDANGRMYVWEKSGKVFIVENGIKQKLPIIDISEEVLNYGDHGLNGFALDPNFQKNGYVYLMYAAKRHHVLFFGKPSYNPDDDSPFQNTIGRITRYTLIASKDFKTIDSTSRKILVGESATTGIPILVDNHGVGSLVFAADGTLLATVGDGAVATEGVVDDSQNAWFQEAIKLGFISADQNINAFKSQSLNSLSGKILRIDPNTGDGIASNPYFESNNPRSAKSRIWSIGLRNPFRFSIKPNTGSSKVSDGNPGMIFLGDVGWFHREEINIVTKGGQNFGWPTYEGIDFVNKSYQNSPYAAPATFQKPVIDWRGTVAQGLINGEPFAVNSPQFKGNSFNGIASIGGLWYNYSQFPREYQNLYYHADYEGWIKAFKFDEKNNPVEVIDFVDEVHPTCLAINPKDGAIYYTNYFYPNIQEIRRLSYNPNANRKPNIVQTATPIYGKSPLKVNFKADQSSDPEGTSLKYEWDFGDGKTSNDANPEHIYESKGVSATYYAIVKVTDAAGLTATKTLRVFVDNSPPVIQSTSIDKIDSFDNLKDFPIILNAQVSDAEQTQINYVWSVMLYHDDHVHLITSFYKSSGEAILGTVPCDAQTYFYKVSLTVTDSEGLSSTFEKKIRPKCSGSEPEPLSISPETSPLVIFPNPTNASIDIFPINEITNRKIKMALFQTNGVILLEKEGFWQEMKPLIENELKRVGEGNFLLKINYENFSKTFKIVKN